MHHLTIRHTQPGEVVRQPQFQPALNLVRPSKTNMVRFAQRNIGSRCTPFACSTTYDAPTRRKASICQRHGRARVCLTPMHVGWGCHRLRRKFSGNPTRLMPPTSSPAPTRRHRAAFTGFTTSSPAALGLPSRARWTTHLHRMFSEQSNRPGFPTVSGREGQA